MKALSIDHIVLIVKDIKRTEAFYSKFLVKPFYQDDESVGYKIRKIRVFFVLPYKKAAGLKLDKNIVGLNHLAFGVSSMAELSAIEKLLVKSKIKNSGIQIDKYENKPFIWLDDPDKARLEFYLRK